MATVANGRVNPERSSRQEVAKCRPAKCRPKVLQNAPLEHTAILLTCIKRSSILICLFDLILYVPSIIFQLIRDGSSWIEPVLSKDKYGVCLAQGHNTVMPVRLEPTAPHS